MNCSNRIYHENDFGFARECACQDGIHLNFGNVSLLLGRKSIRMFADYIDEALQGEYIVEDLDERSIYLPTHDSFMMFVLSYHELEKLYEILRNTLPLLEVEEILSKS
jgi:hypothetical protein